MPFVGANDGDPLAGDLIGGDGAQRQTHGRHGRVAGQRGQRSYRYPHLNESAVGRFDRDAERCRCGQKVAGVVLCRPDDDEHAAIDRNPHAAGNDTGSLGAERAERRADLGERALELSRWALGRTF